MAGNTRGKIKESFEGIHNNFDWSRKHIQKALLLIKLHNPKLTEAFKQLAKGINTLDELAQDIYARI